MCAKWSKGGPPDSLIRLIEAARATGRLNLFNPLSLEAEPSLISFVEFRDDLPECERTLVVRKALASVGESGEITARCLMAQIQKNENLYMEREEDSYVLVTNLSVKYTDRLSPRKLPDVTLTFAPSLPANFDREQQAKSLSENFGITAPASYTWVMVAVCGRSIGDAQSRGMEAIELLRGIWNLHFNRQTRSHLTCMGRTRRANAIFLGPLHTVHKPDGGIADPNAYSYQPEYLASEKLVDVEESWENFEKNETFMLAKVLSSPLRPLLGEAIRRYSEALDERNPQNAFLQLWGALELLTGTERARYEDTVKRAAFLWDDCSQHRQVLEHLRQRRNLAVHGGESHADAETILYQLKRYCEKLIFFLLVRSEEFGSLSAFCEFLDTPTERGEIENRLTTLSRSAELLRLSLQYREDVGKRARGSSETKE